VESILSERRQERLTALVATLGVLKEEAKALLEKSIQFVNVGRRVVVEIGTPSNLASEQ
jgi:hypothetical protein